MITFGSWISDIAVGVEAARQGFANAVDFSLAFRDLQAQEAMASWAMIMTFVSFAGTVGVVFTLWYSRMGVKVALAAGHDQTRAYVEATACEICYAGRLLKPAEHGDEGYILRLKVENFGQTPARWFRVSGTSRVRQYTKEGFTDHETSNFSTSATWQGLFPGQPRTLALTDGHDSGKVHFAAHNDPDNSSYRRLLIATGTLTFQTIHDEERSADFAFTIDGYLIGHHIQERRLFRLAKNKNELPEIEPLAMKFGTIKLISETHSVKR
ncbi:hypothetical protein [Cereibacter changlensis]|uniref:hypothetical protein n=1 Tax=Cereibacter changlensis TaxID=402884 RepID=UPI0040338B8C